MLDTPSIYLFKLQVDIFVNGLFVKRQVSSTYTHISPVVVCKSSHTSSKKLIFNY